MPITSSAKKKAKQDVVARERNRVIRDEYKIACKEVRKLATAGETKKAQDALKVAYSKLDKAAKKNVIHKNNASRKKKRLSALVKSGSSKKATKKITTKKEK